MLNKAFDGVRKIHLIGIGGAGMSGLALLLLELGFEVSGCDLVKSAYSEKLEERKVIVKHGHDVSHISEFTPDLVVYTSAVPENNPELVASKAVCRTVHRSVVLSWIFNEKFGIGIAGTHGKTTTSSMIGTVLERAGLAPTIAVGGELLDVGTNAQLGNGEIMVAELDESDGSFERFKTSVAVVTNIELDHVDHYHDFNEVLSAFAYFAKERRPKSPLIVCADDAGAARLLEYEKDPKQVITYGWGAGWTWGAFDIVHHMGKGVSYSLTHNGKTVARVELSVPGEHNVLNSLAACAACDKVGISVDKFAEYICHFSGAKRRFQFVGQSGDLLIYDDYAHHPTEIAATLNTMRKIYPDKELTVIFQPHRYTRTAILFKDFARALSLADKALLLPIYSADEMPIEGISSQIIADAINDDIISKNVVSCLICQDVNDVLSRICNGNCKKGVVLTLGAGSVGELGKILVKELNA